MINNALIVDDHPLYCDALVCMLQEKFASLTVIAAASAEEGLRMADNMPMLSLILLDLTLPGLCGMEAVAAFYRSTPTALIIVISASDDRRDVSASMRAGARAFISKSATRAMILDAIHRAMTGKLKKAEWIRARGRSVFCAENNLALSRRQIEIMHLLGLGLSNREIAEQVGLAEITVKQHITVIYRVLGVAKRAQALLAIRRFGFG